MSGACPGCGARDYDGNGGWPDEHDVACPVLAAITALTVEEQSAEAAAAHEADRSWFDAHSEDEQRVGRHRPVADGERWLFEDHPRGAGVTHLWASRPEARAALPGLTRYAPCLGCIGEVAP